MVSSPSPGIEKIVSMVIAPATTNAALSPFHDVKTPLRHRRYIEATWLMGVLMNSAI